ncbi:MAG: hypothetical protein HKN62_14075 [Phycisphaerales bacterium]|nr:hypothetical protein [Phycisphaerales bacterium]
MALTALLRRPRFKLPARRLGADLFWWRESSDLHTMVTIYPPGMTNGPVPPVTLACALFDADGTPAGQWTEPVAPTRPVVIDSVRVREERDVPADGVLAVIVSPPRGARRLDMPYSRLYSLIDWYSDEGELVSLHNDQSLQDSTKPIEFTEIVFREADDERTYLILLAGDQPQPAGSLTLEAKNHEGRTLAGTYPNHMTPFSRHRIELAGVMPGLAEFCGDRPAALSGTFACHGLFTRPYVMSETTRLNGYHGGDRYEWDGLPRRRYTALGGRGQVNPMAVLNTEELRTFVNIFNTHGHLEDDCWVDAYLSDADGTLAAFRERWLCATRHELARGAVEDLLPPPDTEFVGHIALCYHDDGRPKFPGTVQALMEYRTAHNTARVMAWADEWNSRERLARPDVTLKAYYRVLHDGRFRSFISITNSGLDLDYDRTAEYTVRLVNVAGEERVTTGRVGPQATQFIAIDELFPDVQSFFGDTPAGIVVVESALDLALVHFTRHRRSGVWSVEHFMSIATDVDGAWQLPCGS